MAMQDEVEVCFVHTSTEWQEIERALQIGAGCMELRRTDERKVLLALLQEVRHYALGKGVAT